MPKVPTIRKLHSEKEGPTMKPASPNSAPCLECGTLVMLRVPLAPDEGVLCADHADVMEGEPGWVPA